jgi:EAL domain-containing protein (putative c-di-GMP-specific phosphodiesterase class I)
MCLRKLGVQIALDDFGTGYAALAVLRDACLDVLKIDKSFVSAMTEGNLDQILVKQIVEMAHAMNLKVVAEGVETQAHQDFLRSIGCDYSQGYLWSRPVAEATFCGWLREKMER